MKLSRDEKAFHCFTFFCPSRFSGQGAKASLFSGDFTGYHSHKWWTRLKLRQVIIFTTFRHGPDSLTVHATFLNAPVSEFLLKIFKGTTLHYASVTMLLCNKQTTDTGWTPKGIFCTDRNSDTNAVEGWLLSVWSSGSSEKTCGRKTLQHWSPYQWPSRKRYACRNRSWIKIGRACNWCSRVHREFNNRDKYKSIRILFLSRCQKEDVKL